MALAIINLPLSASLQTTSASSALVSVLVELFFLKGRVSSEAPRKRHTKYIKTAARLFKTSAEDREEMMVISSLG